MDNITIGRNRSLKFISHLNPPFHTMFYGPFESNSIGYCPYAFQDSNGTDYAPTVKTTLSDYIKIHPKLLYTNTTKAILNNLQPILVLCYGWWDPTRIYILDKVPEVHITKGWKYHVFKEEIVKDIEGVMTFNEFLKLF